MSANIQYNIKYSDVGPIFSKVVPADKREVEFILETKESKYTMVVDLADILDNVLSEYDFDDIATARLDLETGDIDQVTWSDEALSNYDEFNGDYSAYAHYIGEKILSDMNEYSLELEDARVHVETWI